MSSRAGRALSVQLFGESHGPMVGVTLDGLPAGLPLDEGEIAAFLSRRASRGSAIATGRNESDAAKIVSGLKDGITTGQPLTALFDNTDPHSADYGFLPDKPRPGHADYPALVKSGGYDDLRGSGHHSGRMTLPYAFAGAVARHLLAGEGIRVFAHVLAIGGIRDDPVDPAAPDENALETLRMRAFPVLNAEKGDEMREAVLNAKKDGDSLGGVVECVALGVPVGLGSPFFEGAEAVLGAHLFSIPAVKGVEFGAGFHAAEFLGSEYNDPYDMREGRVIAAANSAGGLLGGLTTGMPVVARAAFRPTPSISRPQRTVSLSRGTGERLIVRGRHDPCVVIRAVPVVESAMALGLCELWLQRRGDAPLAGGCP